MPRTAPGRYFTFCFSLLVLIGLTLPLSLMADSNGPDMGETVDIVSEGRRARPIEEPPPEFPRDAKSRLIEGWVQLKYLVNPDGTTSDIEIIDSSAKGFFETAAIDGVSRFRYEPAVWNGFPATDVILDKSIFFFYGENTGEVKRDFHARFRAASRAIDKGELAKAEEIIAELEQRKTWLIAEICYLDLLKAELWRARDNNGEALRFYNRALVVAPVHAKDEIYEILLRRVFVLNTAEDNLAAALENYSDLAALKPDLPDDDPARALASRIRDFVDSDLPYAASGEIESRCEGCTQLSSAWTRKLLRERFTVEQVDGEISEIKIICGQAYVSFVYEPEVAWNVASRWGDCRVMVLGEEGTTFRLVEL